MCRTAYLFVVSEAESLRARQNRELPGKSDLLYGHLLGCCDSSTGHRRKASFLAQTFFRFPVFSEPRISS